MPEWVASQSEIKIKKKKITKQLISHKLKAYVDLICKRDSRK